MQRRGEREVQRSGRRDLRGFEGAPEGRYANGNRRWKSRNLHRSRSFTTFAGTWIALPVYWYCPALQSCPAGGQARCQLTAHAALEAM